MLDLPNPHQPSKMEQIVANDYGEEAQDHLSAIWMRTKYEAGWAGIGISRLFCQTPISP
ncbi:MAG: hypothetical protein JOY85_15335 [Acidobacteriaceae bacterium]|nr:hypothetical protein [Acidobacteriaceae bacterium]